MAKVSLAKFPDLTSGIHETITRVIVDPVLCRHMASSGHYEHKQTSWYYSILEALALPMTKDTNNWQRFCTIDLCRYILYATFIFIVMKFQDQLDRIYNNDNLTIGWSDILVVIEELIETLSRPYPIDLRLDLPLIDGEWVMQWIKLEFGWLTTYIYSITRMKVSRHFVLIISR